MVKISVGSNETSAIPVPLLSFDIKAFNVGFYSTFP